VHPEQQRVLHGDLRRLDDDSGLGPIVGHDLRIQVAPFGFFDGNVGGRVWDKCGYSHTQIGQLLTDSVDLSYVVDVDPQRPVGVLDDRHPKSIIASGSTSVRPSDADRMITVMDNNVIVRRRPKRRRRRGSAPRSPSEDTETLGARRELVIVDRFHMVA
jgi:hypothetical protein